MGARFSRLVSVAAAGGVLTGSLLFGAGVAMAAPTPAAGGQVVPAQCGQSVQASPGDTVKVTPLLGLPMMVPITSAAGPLQSINQSIAGSLCQVQVQLVQPATTAVAAAAPALKPATDTVEKGSRTALGGQAPAASPAAQAPAAAPQAAAAPLPAVAPAPLAPAALAASAPAFAPSFNTLPSSFLGASAPASAPGGLPTYDAGQLLGSSFPGLKAGAPAYLGYDPASAVTTASQVQALPVDGMSGGMGVPVMLAVLALAGVAAFVVRSIVLRRATSSAASAPEDVADETDETVDPISAEALTEVRSPAPESPAVGFPAVRDEHDETELMGTAAR
jgi:hypothetical protein